MPSLKSSINKGVSLDDVCYLITSESTEDDLGQIIEGETTERLIFCTEKSISRAEFNAAGQQGTKPAIELIVDSDEYDRESKVKFEDTVYSIYRSFRRDDGNTELYCEVKSNDKYQQRDE